MKSTEERGLHAVRLQINCFFFTSFSSYQGNISLYKISLVFAWMCAHLVPPLIDERNDNGKMMDYSALKR